METAYWRGNSLLIYQHFPMEKRPQFIARIAADLRGLVPTAAVWAFRTPHVVFLLLIHPDHHVALHPAAQSVSDAFDPKFLAGAHHPLV